MWDNDVDALEALARSGVEVEKIVCDTVSNMMSDVHLRMSRPWLSGPSPASSSVATARKMDNSHSTSQHVREQRRARDSCSSTAQTFA